MVLRAEALGLDAMGKEAALMCDLQNRSPKIPHQYVWRYLITIKELVNTVGAKSRRASSSRSRIATPEAIAKTRSTTYGSLASCRSQTSCATTREQAGKNTNGGDCRAETQPAMIAAAEPGKHAPNKGGLFVRHEIQRNGERPTDDQCGATRAASD